MTARYLEDFALGQTYGSGRIRIDGDRIKSFGPSSIRSPFISMRKPPVTAYFAAWRRAAGTRPRSRCDC